MTAARVTLPTVLGLAVAGCAPAPETRGLDAPVPADRMDAIRSAARSGHVSRHDLARLVEQLDSDDPAVRFVAIGTLERITGLDAGTHGFRYDDPASQRRVAVDWWVRYVNERTPDAGDANGPDASVPDTYGSDANGSDANGSGGRHG